MTKEKKFGGRPGRKPKAGERVHIGFRVSPSLKRKVESAAKKNTRSISQEAEYRLEKSFDFENFFGGPAIQFFAFRLSSAFYGAGTSIAGGKEFEEWRHEKMPYVAGARSVVDMLLREFIGSPKDKKFIADEIRVSIDQFLARQELDK